MIIEKAGARFVDNWRRADFLVTIKDQVHAVGGLVHQGGGLALAPCTDDWPSIFAEGLWSVTHLGTGHAVVFVFGTEQIARQVGDKLADAIDWGFYSLKGWLNADPSMLKKLGAVIGGFPPGVIRKSFQGENAVGARKAALGG